MHWPTLDGSWLTHFPLLGKKRGEVQLTQLQSVVNMPQVNSTRVYAAYT